MRRRSVLRALLGTAGVSALAGCNALLGRKSTATSTRATGTEPPSDDSGTATVEVAGPPESPQSGSEASSPFRTSDAPALDRPRGVHVRNPGSTARFVTAVVTAPTGEEVMAESVTVDPETTVSFRNLLASAGEYGVLVETAEGRRRRYTWAVDDRFDDLWIDLTPAVSFRRPVVCTADCPFAVGDWTVGYDVPAGVDVREALGRSPALALDTDTDADDGRRVRLKIWHQGRLRLDARYDLPPDVRALVPVYPASRRYDILVRSDGAEAIYDWQPTVRNTLYVSLAGGPTFRCGDANHDVRVRNETDRERRIRLRVLTGEETLFERTFDVDPSATETVPAAVAPAGPFRFEVDTADGLSEQYNWVRCAPNGPITVTVSDDGVYVSVQPDAASSRSLGRPGLRRSRRSPDRAAEGS
jgi:hypothetical protein